MIDRIFTLTLTFAVLCGATLAIGGEYFSAQSTPEPIDAAVIVLPRVVITGEVQPAPTSMASADSGTENKPATNRVR